MKTKIFCSVFIVLAFFWVFNVQSLKVIPQKINVTYINEKYIKWANVTVKRYGRKSDYYMNAEGEKYHTWDNNITYQLIFYEYLHNEYRRSFVEMRFKLCDLINKDPYIGQMFVNKGVKCPVIPKEVHLMNLTLPMKNFPYVLPFEKARIDCSLSITKTGERLIELYMFTLFKDNTMKKL